MKPIIRFAPLITALFLFTIIFVFSCKKENGSVLTPQEEAKASMTTTQSDAEADFVFNDVFDNVMGVNNDVGMAGTGVFGLTAVSGGSGGTETARTDTVPNSTPCFTVTVEHLSSAIFPIRITIDFGTVGCPGRYGHIRKGKIITTYTNRLVFPGATATTTFQDFYIDSIKVEGTHTISNTSTSNVLQFKVDITDGKLSKPSGNYTEWTSHKTITQIEGLGTPYVPFDDIYRIEGASNGKVKTGDLIVVWRSEIIDPLIKRVNCRWIVKGQVRTIRVTSSNTATPADTVLDFGDGTCDNQATITINGVVYQITLH